MLTRRELLERTSLALGWTVAGSTAAAMLGGCRIDRRLDWTPRLFTPQQAVTIGAMADHLLPATSTPGAAELMVDRFIDAALKDFASEEEQRAFLEGLAAFDASCRTLFDRSFVGATPAQRDEVFRHYEKSSPPVAPNVWGGQISDVVEAPVFYRHFKQLALAGYFASERVGEQLLAYDPIPGRFDGCIPLSSVGKAWSL